MRSRWKGVPSLLGDLGLRLAAIALAICVVFLTRAGARQEQVIAVPLQLTGIPDTLIAATVPPPSIDVRFRGSAGSLVRLRLNPPVIRIDLSQLTPGRIQEREIRPADVSLPSRAGASVVAVIAPRFVLVGVDRSVARSLIVQPAWSGALPQGWTLGAEPTLLPREVRVEGPASIVLPLTALKTVPIDLARERSALPFAVRLVAPPPPARVTPEVVSVRLALDPLTEETFRDLPVQILSNRLVRRAVASPARVSLTLRGPRSLLALVRPSALSPYVDARNLLSGKHFILVRVTTPGPDLQVVGTDPDHVAVTLD